MVVGTKRSKTNRSKLGEDLVHETRLFVPVRGMTIPENHARKMLKVLSL